MLDPILLPVSGVAGLTIAFVTSVRFLTRWLELRRSPGGSDALRELRDVQERLARIEGAVDTTALEVERIAEANRFVAKVLAERAPVALPRPAVPERVITPY